MKIKGLIDEDFVNYKLPSMFIATSKCSFKCDAECGKAVCQNLPLATAPVIDVSCKELVNRYMSNNIYVLNKEEQTYYCEITKLSMYNVFLYILVF